MFLSELAHVVIPRRRLRVVDDEPGSRILECSVAGRADAIVTGDRDWLALGTHRNVKIITLREYLDLSDAP